jgi:phosphoenolpyruvate carboxylase
MHFSHAARQTNSYALDLLIVKAENRRTEKGRKTEKISDELKQIKVRPLLNQHRTEFWQRHHLFRLTIVLERLLSQGAHSIVTIARAVMSRKLDNRTIIAFSMVRNLMSQ